MHIIAVANRKGGAGKSTVSANVAAAFGLDGQRVLVIDMDSQGSASDTLLENMPKDVLNMAHVLVGNKTLDEVIRPSSVKGVWVAPATEQLTHAQLNIVDKPGRETILRRALRDIRGFDIAIIDTAPERQLGTVNALVASTHVVMPFNSDKKALEGLGTTAQAVLDIVEAELAMTEVLGCVQTDHDTRVAVSCNARDKVKAGWGDLLFKTALRTNSSFVLCPAVHRSIFEIERKAPRRGSEDVRALAREIRTRLNRTAPKAAAKA